MHCGPQHSSKLHHHSMGAPQDFTVFCQPREGLGCTAGEGDQAHGGCGGKAFRPGVCQGSEWGGVYHWADRSQTSNRYFLLPGAVPSTGSVTVRDQFECQQSDQA